jgi:hypothetical protein
MKNADLHSALKGLGERCRSGEFKFETCVISRRPGELLTRCSEAARVALIRAMQKQFRETVPLDGKYSPPVNLAFLCTAGLPFNLSSRA